MNSTLIMIMILTNKWKQQISCLTEIPVLLPINAFHTYCFLFHLHRQNTVLVSANDISIEQTDDGLQLTFFVRGGSGDTSGVIPAEAVIEAVQVSTTIAQGFIIMKRITYLCLNFDGMLVFKTLTIPLFL